MIEYTIAEVARKLRCCEGSVRHLIRTGRLAARRDHRRGPRGPSWWIAAADLDAYLAQPPVDISDMKRKAAFARWRPA